MDFEEMRCPGCGAPINPVPGQKVYRCEYCNTVYMPEDNSFDEEKEQIQLQMERDKAKANKERLEWDNKEYKRKKRSQEKVRKRQEREFEREQKRQSRRAASGNKMGCFIIVLFFIGWIVLYVFNYYKDNPENLKAILNSQYEESSVPEQKIIKSLDEVPKVTLDKINNDSLKRKEGMYESLYDNWKNEGSEIVGDYLVSYDTEDGNLIFSVVKTTYSCGDPSKTQTLYTVFVTSHLCIKENGTTVQSHPEKTPDYVDDINDTMYLDPDAGIPSMVHGWTDIKTLYKECISYIEVPYHVSYTEGMYVPKNAGDKASQSSYIPSTGDLDAEEEETVSEE